MKNIEALKLLLDRKAEQYNHIDFISSDPICIPHSFSKTQDREIMGFLAATLAWGQRPTIINNCRKLIEHMDGAPYDFVMHHREKDLQRMEGFVHRTFNDTDLLYFLSFFRAYYKKHDSLEDAFYLGMKKSDETVEQGLNHFKELFFSLAHVPARTRKHVASPAQNSACKRINMFLRWMVRTDKKGVDFGIWKKIKPAQLMCPLDVHSGRSARKLGLLIRRQDDWKAVVELSAALRLLDAKDPVKYDFALYGMGVFENKRS